MERKISQAPSTSTDSSHSRIASHFSPTDVSDDPRTHHPNDVDHETVDSGMEKRRNSISTERSADLEKQTPSKETPSSDINSKKPTKDPNLVR